MQERSSQTLSRWRNTAAVVLMLTAAGRVSTAQTADAAAATTPPNPPSYVPMTASERFTTYLRQDVSLTSFVSSAASAGIGQWRDRPKEWKQGGEGFGLRYGSAFAQHITRETLTYGASSLLHEDNRYFASRRTGFGSRLEYALASTFLARHDDGTQHFSFSGIGGIGGAALISRAWQPHSTSTMRNAGISSAISIGVKAGFNVGREFVPRLFHPK
jgi:hypothetical protein